MGDSSKNSLTDRDNLNTSAKLESATASNAGPMMTVLHRQTRQCIPIADKVGDLLSTIAQVTGVHPDEQVLISRGKKVDISNWLINPAAVGIIDGTVALITGGRAASKSGSQHSSNVKKSNVLSDSVPLCLRTIRNADKEVVDLREQFTQVMDAVTRHTKGFLDKDMTNDALKRDDVVRRALDEKLMKILEELDGLTHPEGDDEQANRLRAQWRAERKSVVEKIHVLLKDVDALRDRIRTLREDSFGEVVHHRGNPS